jgi:hypothetical protein
MALRRALLLIAAAALVWRVLGTAMSTHYAERAAQGNQQSVDKALIWSDHQPEALYRKALTLRDEHPEAAADYLVRAFAENPGDARPMIEMADLLQSRGDQERSEALVNAAVSLYPSAPWVQRRAAAYWVSRGDLPSALRHWSLALETDPGLRRDLFPVLLRLAEDPRTRFAFDPIADSPPSWWEAFFADAAEKVFDVEAVRLLYSLRRASSKAPVTQAERRDYVARLLREGRVTEAYVEWVNGLDRDQRARLALLHDGGFELEPVDWGFGWRLQSTPKALIDRATTYGVDGDTALHLVFDNHKGRFARVSQSLFLDPGSYRLTGRVRTDSLKTKGGLKWVVRCLLPEAMDLGESERFLGANEWRDFSFHLEVPTECQLQELRLVSAGKRGFEHEMTGGAWFDRLVIREQSKPSPGPS